MRRVQPQRGEDGPDLGAIKILHPGAVGVGSSAKARKRMPCVGQGGTQFLAPALVLALDQLADAADDGPQVFRRRSGRRGCAPTTALSICCLRPATRTSKNSSRLELKMQKNFTRSSRGVAGVQRLLQDAMVELQPAQFAVDEVLRLQFQCWRLARHKVSKYNPPGRKVIQKGVVLRNVTFDPDGKIPSWRGETRPLPTTPYFACGQFPISSEVPGRALGPPEETSKPFVLCSPGIR